MATNDNNNKVARPLTDEEFEQIWPQAKARIARLEAEFAALSAEGKKRLKEKFSDPFYERISENRLGCDARTYQTAQTLKRAKTQNFQGSNQGNIKILSQYPNLVELKMEK
jgi:hypothetical protein